MLIEDIIQEAGGDREPLVVSLALAGVANACVLAVVNYAIESSSLALFAAFLLICALYGVSFRLSVGKLSSILERMMCKTRVRLFDKLRRAELRGLERIGVERIYEQLSHQTGIISMSGWPIAIGLQSAILLICTTIKLSYSSPTALLVTLVVGAVGSAFYYLRSLQAAEYMKRTSDARIRLFSVLNDLLRGSKEVRFSTKRSDELYADFGEQAAAVQTAMVDVSLQRVTENVIGNLNQFAVLGTIVFVLPQFVSLTTTSLSELTSSLLFMFAPLGGVLFALPEYGKADAAAQSIRQLEQELETLAAPVPVTSVDSVLAAEFQELRIVELEYRHLDPTGQAGFALGPVNLTVRAGEITFIVGGNGSGKTTFLRNLTALYQPTSGGVYVDDVQVTPTNAQAYRNMISAIFSDFHLFKKLYGLAGIDDAEVQRLLAQMELSQRTQLVQGAWSTVDLSTGQRKRLAMIVALMEDRPIYIFDEWAADQDPEFRRYFYEGLLQDLKRRGKTVIAISHDDRYFHCADQVVTMEYGKIRSIELPGQVALSTLVPAEAAAQQERS